MKREDIRIKQKRKKRIGRGVGSRRGTYSGRGVKGQKSRAGASIRPGFEGGQTTIAARFPKRRGGAVSSREKVFPVNVSRLESTFRAGAQINLRFLSEAGIIPKNVLSVKILGNGELKKPFTVHLPVSSSAKQKIEDAGGKVVYDTKG